MTRKEFFRPYFQKSEFDCKCGCGTNHVHWLFLKMLNQAREMANMPFVITSGCRCEKHNKAIGGKPNSSHLSTVDKECFAADIRCRNSYERALIIKSAVLAGFNRIGIGKDFIHLDHDLDKDQPLIWLY